MSETENTWLKVNRSVPFETSLKIMALLSECDSQPSEPAEMMQTEAHTAGPWEVGPVDDTVVTHLGADGRRYEVAAIDGDYNQPDEWPVMEANARLISAAPDMLAALKAAQTFIANGRALGFIRMPDAETPDPAHQTPGLIDAAISKATGQS